MAMLTPSPATPPAWLAREERHAARHAIRFETRLSVGTDEAIAVTIADLTQLGCRVIGRGGLTMGKYVTLDLAPVGPVQGWIAWTRGDECGVDFGAPLTARGFVTLARRARGEVGTAH